MAGFIMSNDLFGLPQNKPNRVGDLSSRPEPARPDLEAAEPWFVAPEAPQKSSQYTTKSIVKRLVSVVVPLSLLVVIGLVVATVIRYALGMYQ